MITQRSRDARRLETGGVKRPLLTVWSITLLMGTAIVPSAAGASLYEVYTGVTILPGIGVSESTSGSMTVEKSLSRSGSNAPRFGQARAKAGPGGLLAFAYVEGQGVVPSTFVGSGVSADAVAKLVVDDLEISSPFPAQTQIATRLNLRLRGVIGFDDTTLAGIIYDEQRADIYVTIDLPGPLTDGSGQSRLSGSFRLLHGDGVETIQRTGVLADLFGVDVTHELGNFERRVRIDANVTTPDFYAPVNTPVSAGIEIAVYSSQGSREGFGILSSDFEHTLTFAPDRPVFDLPPGYTANSAAAGIVDNRFVIPEPSSLALFVAGAIVSICASLLRRTSIRFSNRLLPTLVNALIFLGFTAVATAANRYWVGGDGAWDNIAFLKWSSTPVPTLQSIWDEPDPDDFAIFLNANSVELANASEAIAGLTMSGGSWLSTNDNFLNVDGLAELSDGGTTLAVGGSNSILLADAITINSGARLSLTGGSVGLDGNAGTGVLDVNAGGSVSGNGLIYFPAASDGTEVFDLDGTLTATTTYPDPLTADPTNSAASTLTISISNPAAVVDLDGNSGNSTINVNRNDTLVIKGGVLQSAFSGTMNLGEGATFSRVPYLPNDPTDLGEWSLDGTLNTTPGGVGSFGGVSTIEGGKFVQAGGSINIDAGETLRISSKSFEAYGTINNSGHIVFNTSDDIDVYNTQVITNGVGGTFNMTGPTASLTVEHGARAYIQGSGPDLFALDGDGASTNVTTINGGTLYLAGPVDQLFTGTLNFNGGFIYNGNWTLGGTTNVGADTGTSTIIVPSVQWDDLTVTFNGQVNIGSNSVLSVYELTVYDGATFSGAGGTLLQNRPTSVAANTLISVGTYRWDIAPTTVDPGAALVIDVNNFGDSSDEYNNTITVNSGTLDVAVADDEWQLGTGGTIKLTSTSTSPTLAGQSKLQAYGGYIDVDSSAAVGVIANDVILQRDAVKESAIRFVGDGGALNMLGHLELSGGSVYDITEDPSHDTEFNLYGGLTVAGPVGSFVGVDTFRWDLSPTTIEFGASFGVYADAIELSGQQRYDNTLTINGGTLDVDLGNYASWIMDEYLILSNTLGMPARVSGDLLEIGDDVGWADANLWVKGAGASYISAPVHFMSDADVYIDAGATLITDNATYFSPVGTYNGLFHGAAISAWRFRGPVTFNEATTIDMPQGFVDLDGDDAIDNTISIFAPATLNVGSMGAFGYGTMNIIASIGTGRLMVNLTDPAAKWSIGSGATINCFGNSPSDVFLAGSDINLYGTINIYGDGQIAARLDIEGSGEVNIFPSANIHLSGGSLTDPNTIHNGRINGPNPLFLAENRALVGYGEISAGIFLEAGAELRAADGFLYVYNGVYGVGGAVGTANEDGRLYVADPWNTSQVNYVDLEGGALTGEQVTNDGVIRGFGTVNVNQLVNNGRVSANGGTLTLDRFASNASYDWDGSGETGVLDAIDGNMTLRAGGFAPFGGTINIGLNRELFVDGFTFFHNSHSIVNVAGGVYRSNTVLEFGGDLNINDATSEIDSPGAFLAGGVTTLGADLQLRQSMTINENAAFTGNGGSIINLNGATLTIQNGATVDVPIVNQGTLVLGASPGQLALPAYTQTETGALEIELGGTGPTDFDRLIVAGQASIAGTLNLSLIGDFVPSHGDTFDFLAVAGGIIGSFDTINLPSLPIGLSWSLNNSDPTMVELSVIEGLTGDFNQDGTVDAADYIAWRKGLGPIFTESHFNIWRSHFGESSGGGAVGYPLGASAASSSAVVPEPTSLGLILLAVLGRLIVRRRR